MKRAVLRHAAVIIMLALPAVLTLSRWGLEPRVSAADLAAFSRDMAGFMTAGLNVPAGLKAVEERIASPYFRMAIRDVSRDIENGSALSTAMARHPDVFSMSYVAAVQYGEQTATLDLVMISLGQGKPIHVRPQWHRRLARRRKGV